MGVHAMPLNEQELKESYRFRDASDIEDILIRQFLIAIQDLPTKDSRLSYFFKKAAPVIILAIFAFCLYAGFTSGFRTGLVLVPIALAATYGFEMARVLKQRWESSGIRYDFHKNSGHFFTASAVCNEKNVQKGFLGHSRFLANAKISGGKSLSQIPLIKPHYEAVQNGARIFVVAAQKADGFCFFALPQNFFPAGISHNPKKAAQSQSLKLRPMEKNDRDQILALEKERIRIRRRLYMKNQLLVIGLILVFLAYQIFRAYDAGITLGIFILLAASSIYFSYYLQDRGYRKALTDKKELLCTDATAHLSTDGEKPSVLFKSRDNRLLFTSNAKDDLHWFHTGDQALLVYYSQETPVAYKIP